MASSAVTVLRACALLRQMLSTHNGGFLVMSADYCFVPVHADVVRSLVHHISPDALQIVDAFGIPAHLLGPLAAGAIALHASDVLSHQLRLEMLLMSDASGVLSA